MYDFRFLVLLLTCYLSYTSHTKTKFFFVLNRVNQPAGTTTRPIRWFRRTEMGLIFYFRFPSVLDFWDRNRPVSSPIVCPTGSPTGINHCQRWWILSTYNMVTKKNCNIFRKITCYIQRFLFGLLLILYIYIF